MSVPCPVATCRRYFDVHSKLERHLIRNHSALMMRQAKSNAKGNPVTENQPAQSQAKKKRQPKSRKRNAPNLIASASVGGPSSSHFDSVIDIRSPSPAPLPQVLALGRLKRFSRFLEVSPDTTPEPASGRLVSSEDLPSDAPPLAALPLVTPSPGASSLVSSRNPVAEPDGSSPEPIAPQVSPRAGPTTPTWVTSTPPRFAGQREEYDQLATDEECAPSTNDNGAREPDAVSLSALDPAILGSSDALETEAMFQVVGDLETRKQRAPLSQITRSDWTGSALSRFIAEPKRSLGIPSVEEGRERTPMTDPALVQPITFTHVPCAFTPAPHAHEPGHCAPTIPCLELEKARSRSASASDYNAPHTPEQSNRTQPPSTPPLTSSTELSRTLDTKTTPGTPSYIHTPGRYARREAIQQSLLTTIHTLVDILACDSSRADIAAKPRPELEPSKYNCHAQSLGACGDEKKKPVKRDMNHVADLAEEVARRIRSRQEEDLEEAKDLVAELSTLLQGR